jgi:hypothetical protein
MDYDCSGIVTIKKYMQIQVHVRASTINARLSNPLLEKNGLASACGAVTYQRQCLGAFVMRMCSGKLH